MRKSQNGGLGVKSRNSKLSEEKLPYRAGSICSKAYPTLIPRSSQKDKKNNRLSIVLYYMLYNSIMI